MINTNGIPICTTFNLKNIDVYFFKENVIFLSLRKKYTHIVMTKMSLHQPAKSGFIRLSQRLIYDVWHTAMTRDWNYFWFC